MSTVPDPAAPDASVVRALLAEQYPSLAREDIRPVSADGTSNWVFRVGEEHAVRLPRSQEYVGDLRREARWLPRLAPDLPVPVPEVVFLGAPAEAFGRPWTVVTWVPGTPPEDLEPSAQPTFARDLGRFVRALHAIDTAGVEAGPDHWGYRAGEPVTARSDGWLDRAADDLRDLFDPGRVRQAWSRLRDVPPPSAPPCWIHTDLSAENLLVAPDGRLTGVIDFGGVGVGDRSVDLLYAWGMFDPQPRELFRRESGADEATWLRGRAWAFVGPGLVTLADYRDTMPRRTARLTRMVEAVARDVGVELYHRGEL
jgi:aminoglycoside phosphotransferase (APT) family kinase protein